MLQMPNYTDNSYHVTIIKYYLKNLLFVFQTTSFFSSLSYNCLIFIVFDVAMIFLFPIVVALTIYERVQCQFQTIVDHMTYHPCCKTPSKLQAWVRVNLYQPNFPLFVYQEIITEYFESKVILLTFKL